MKFRERRRVIQVIRTTDDPDVTRGRSEVLGKIDKAAPAVTDKLQKACTPEELSEIAAYLANRRNGLHDDAVGAGAETLPARMRAAAEYFRSHRDDEARVFAAEIRLAWDELKGALREAGFSKSKLRKTGGGTAAPAVAEKAEEVASKPAPVKKAAPEKKPAVRKAPVTKRTAAAAIALAAQSPAPVVTVDPAAVKAEKPASGD